MVAIVLTKRDERLLKLVIEGASSKAAAKALDIEPGTVRVYYHQLYRKIGVKNKIGAMVWYLRYREAMRKGGGLRDTMPAAPPAYDLGNGAEFGDYALANGLFSTLGVHSLFLGPNSRIWDVLHGQPNFAVQDEVRSRAQAIWEMFLKGEFETIATLHGQAAQPAAANQALPSLPLALALVFAGNSGAGAQLAAQLDARHASGNFARALLRALQDSLVHNNNAGLAYLTQLATETPTRNPHKHLAMVALFHLYRARGDAVRAKAVANAIFCEAELVRNFLETRCNAHLYSNTTLPAPPPYAAEEWGAYVVADANPDGRREDANQSANQTANEAAKETAEQGEPIAIKKGFYCDDRR